MKNNAELQKDVQQAIKYEPLLHAAEIGVTAKDGVVSLTGIVDSYVKKLEAENAAKKVIGVRALVEHIEVKFPSTSYRTDAEIASDVLIALKNNYSVPEEKIKVKVENGIITLEGMVIWNYQRDAAQHVLNHLPGIKGLINNIIIKPEASDLIDKKDIERQLAEAIQ
ncbi:BON domain-containing protein [Sphingobacterium sp. KU25419]|nr:BON domain-containing protein [Sphingobacterium sp. KU25419]